MIKTLRVKHIALIDDMELSFHSGLTALTGETGAGKSIIMESLQLLFGKRSDQDLIRHGFEEAVVSGDFELSNETARAFDLPKHVTISRVMSRSGRHIMKLNNKQTTLQYIKQLTKTIGDIHEQDDMFQLLDQSMYVQMIDERDSNRIEPLKVEYMLKKSAYEDAIKKLKKLQDEKDTFEAQKEMLLFQLEELEHMNLEEGELEKISEELETLKHYDRIANSLKASVGMLKDNHLISAMQDVKSHIEIISSHMQSKKDIHTRFEDAYYNVEDIASELSDMLEHLDYNEAHFQTLNEREFALIQLQKKYQKDISELIVFTQELRDKTLLASDYQTFIKKQNEKIDMLKKEVSASAQSLTNERKRIALDMQKEMIRVMKTLDLEHTKFNIDFETSEIFLDHGCDTISFSISLNEGEPLKPLHKVASGGERARFMFALKTTAAKHHGVSLLILDEIDTGVSGKTAAKLATHMARLSSSLQLVVITHLPQVAAKADHHILVEKKLHDARMTTSIKYLTHDDRVKAIAYMLSDETMSPFAIEQAKTMLRK